MSKVVHEGDFRLPHLESKEQQDEDEDEQNSDQIVKELRFIVEWNSKSLLARGDGQIVDQVPPDFVFQVELQQIFGVRRRKHVFVRNW